MLKSKQNRPKIEEEAFTSRFNQTDDKGRTVMIEKSMNPKFKANEIKYYDSLEITTSNKKKNCNLNFKYESYLKLRNLFYLAMFLQTKKLRQHRVHAVLNSQKNDQEEELHETFLENVTRPHFVKSKNNESSHSILKIVEDSVSKVYYPSIETN